MIISVLEKFGLTKNESKIVLSLLDHGPMLAGAISNKTGIHRRNVYDALSRLIEKGVVSYIKTNNRRYFEAVNPSRFLDLLNEKKDAINEIMPKLQKKYKGIKEKEETTFYKGKNGLKTVFEDQIRENKEILIIGASPIANKMLKYYFMSYNRKRKEKNIKIKIVTSKDNELKGIPLAKIKYLPKEYNVPSAINIYGNKTAIILWSEEEPLAILIRNKEITKSYKKYFDLFWKIAKE